ncbi:MAG: penicillin-binding protein 1B [Gammaproteobacteria bacterium]|nr:MAG: penicillin-binding protein 1B [Gammaproteobacteria bacterium]
MLLFWAALVSAPLVVGYLFYLDREVRTQFEGKRWAVPARVFARPLELFPGLPLSPAQLEKELQLLRYTKARRAQAPGSYVRAGEALTLRTRGFRFADDEQGAQSAVVRFAGGRIASLSTPDGRSLPLLRIEPLEIGGIYPAHNEDRVLVRLGEVPPILLDTLLTIEDRHFYTHYGVDPTSIARALWANLRSGRVSQGGSTLTQQLVKNFFLTPERSLWRKVNEALMALLLEWRYSKPEILEAYLNEVYLGQNGARAIHGFGRASLDYFGMPLAQVDLPRAALLVTLLRGASYYDPRRNPERARERRDRIISTMEERGLVDARVATDARRAPLGVSKERGASAVRYPAFFDLVRRQLRRDYRDEDLRSEGLRIFTTLDPLIQADAETAVARELPALEKTRKLPGGKLQSAVIISRSEGGEVLAVTGGRRARYAGFNRALDAVRPIGSLVKPAIYLAALERGYTLATPIEDAPFQLTLDDGSLWEPNNYNRQAHGYVPLYRALANSYNLATARLGMETGLPRTIAALERIGLRRPVRAYPSLLLGAVEMSPLEVTQLYQTLAGNGFYTPLKAIREVVAADGTQLQRYPLTVEQRVDPATVYQLTYALQEVVRSGTARSLVAPVAALRVAGKTGTTDDLRDSWFAGYSGEHVAVVWVGRDDNEPTGLTGATGALRVWGRIVAGLRTAPLAPVPPEGTAMAWLELDPPRRSAEGCPGAVQLPMPTTALPVEASPCGQRAEGGDPLTNWIKGLLE